MTDRYYRAQYWRRLRATHLKLDNHTCIVAACGKRVVVVDHVKHRCDGGDETIENTRSLCRERVKERSSGQRANVVTDSQELSCAYGP